MKQNLLTGFTLQLRASGSSRGTNGSAAENKKTRHRPEGGLGEKLTAAAPTSEAWARSNPATLARPWLAESARWVSHHTGLVSALSQSAGNEQAQFVCPWTPHVIVCAVNPGPLRPWSKEWQNPMAGFDGRNRSTGALEDCRCCQGAVPSHPPANRPVILINLSLPTTARPEPAAVTNATGRCHCS